MMMKCIKKLIDVVSNHNWFAIFYFNFKMLPIKQAIYLPFDFYHKIRFESLNGKVVLNSDRLYRGMIKIGSAGSEMFPHQATIMIIDGELRFTGHCVIGVNSCCRCYKTGVITFGEDVTIGAGNLIFCQKEISFGDGFLSSWNCQYMDTDTHPIYEQTGLLANSNASIVFGRHTWLGNNVCINKGTCIPANTIVASHSLCNKNYTNEGEKVILAGTPARGVKRNVTWNFE